jgi:ElaB/YqjD/DUF883 family membrane-anchored ribosome-binding protein
MNGTRRKQIEEIKAKIEALRDDVDSVMQEEQDAFDNMPECLQASDRGEKAQEAIDALRARYNEGIAPAPKWKMGNHLP